MYSWRRGGFEYTNTPLFMLAPQKCWHKAVIPLRLISFPGSFSPHKVAGSYKRHLSISNSYKLITL
jgi:hypothetical protein